MKSHQTGGDAHRPAAGQPGGAAEFYLQKSEECRRQAQATSDPDKRDQWLDMANQWLRLSRDTRRRGANHQ